MTPRQRDAVSPRRVGLLMLKRFFGAGERSERSLEFPPRVTGFLPTQWGGG